MEEYCEIVLDNSQKLRANEFEFEFYKFMLKSFPPDPETKYFDLFETLENEAKKVYGGDPAPAPAQSSAPMGPTLALPVRQPAPAQPQIREEPVYQSHHNLAISQSKDSSSQHNLPEFDDIPDENPNIHQVQHYATSHYRSGAQSQTRSVLTATGKYKQDIKVVRKPNGEFEILGLAPVPSTQKKENYASFDAYIKDYERERQYLKQAILALKTELEQVLALRSQDYLQTQANITKLNEMVGQALSDHWHEQEARAEHACEVGLV